MYNFLNRFRSSQNVGQLTFVCSLFDLYLQREETPSYLFSGCVLYVARAQLDCVLKNSILGLQALLFQGQGLHLGGELLYLLC